MNDVGVSGDGGLEAQPPMPVRRLHNFIYCPRLFYFQWVENIFQENADTVSGSHVHRNADRPSIVEDPRDIGLPDGAVLRSLKLESPALGIVGVVDIVEGGPDGAEIIDYKKGSARRSPEGEREAKEPDVIQVAAYALLLEEQGIRVARAWIYYAADKRRVAVPLGEEVFTTVRGKIQEARSVAAAGRCPPPLSNDARCLHCSAHPICLPNESLWWSRHPLQSGPESQPPAVASRPSDDVPQGRMHVRGPQPGGSDPAIQAPRPDRDDGEVLVVQSPGAQVGQRGDQIVVSVKGEEVKRLPGNQVRAIYCYGAVQLTAQAVATCLEVGIDVSYFSPAGRFIGLLGGLPTSGVDARRGQYRLFELPDVRLRLARETIRTKIHNQRVMLMRNGAAPDRALALMAALRDATASAPDIPRLLGIEGNAAAIYFEHFGTMLKRRDEWAFDWQGRNRRPPRDPVNALLSLGYSMLAKELTGVCHAVGLDPFFGFLHQPRYGRPALALDLMEEFRPLIADSVAISLINRGEVGADDFIKAASGTFLNDRGRKAFWEAWFRRFDTEVCHPEFGYRMAYRRMLEVQGRQLWRFVRGEALAYHGFTTR